MSTPAPDGLVKVAWATYPSLRGVWKPSKVHLGYIERGAAKCGARKSRGAVDAKGDVDFSEHEKEAGLCSKCWRPRKGRGR